MADLANEGRGGAVWGQLAARERAAGGPGATGPRGEHSGCVGPVCSGRAAQRALQPQKKGKKRRRRRKDKNKKINTILQALWKIPNFKVSMELFLGPEIKEVPKTEQDMSEI